ncbi:MAG: HIT family protein [Candidatus Poseidoniales archaeon]|jgi:histidine triad (HIT) family protein|nr:HIT family protein [Candidatus Poseidoniales archaeon]
MDESDPSIFTLIIQGNIPCHKVYEDEHVFSFLDINPCSIGHTLVVPKEQSATLDGLSEEASAAVGRVLPRISRAVLAASGASDFNVLQNNGEAAFQSVFHVHFHIIPKHDDGSGLTWPFATTQLDPGEGAILAERIRNHLK